MPRPKISQRKLSQIAIKSWNSQTFSPLKVSYYMVQYYIYSLPDHYAHTWYYWFQSGPNLCDSLWMEATIKRCKNGTCIHQHESHDRNEADSSIQAGTGQPLPQRVQSKVKNMLLRTLQKQHNNKLLTSCSLMAWVWGQISHCSICFHNTLHGHVTIMISVIPLGTLYCSPSKEPWLENTSLECVPVSTIDFQQQLSCKPWSRFTG